MIYPFHDAPNVGVSVIFYAVPETNPLAPPTCFVPRWWEYKDGYRRSGVGTDDKWTIYRGPIPVIPVEPFEGEREWWKTGLSYARYLAGGYSNRGPCISVPPTVLSPILQGKATASGARRIVYAFFPEMAAKARARATVTNVWSDSVMCEGRSTATASGSDGFEIYMDGKSTMNLDPSQSLTTSEGRSTMNLDPSQSLTTSEGKSVMVNLS